MLDKINQDIKDAMKAKNKPQLDALRMLKASFLENKTSKEPKDPSEVAISHVKRIKDSIESFPEDSAEREKLLQEVEYLKEYLPTPMSRADVEHMVKTFIAENEEANFGMVMKFISPKVKGKFDGREASQMVKSLLE